MRSPSSSAAAEGGLMQWKDIGYDWLVKSGRPGITGLHHDRQCVGAPEFLVELHGLVLFAEIQALQVDAGRAWGKLQQFRLILVDGADVHLQLAARLHSRKALSQDPSQGGVQVSVEQARTPARQQCVELQQHRAPINPASTLEEKYWLIFRTQAHAPGQPGAGRAQFGL